MSDRIFTLDEAQNLVPVLESLLRTAMTGKKAIQEIETELQEARRRVFLMGGMQLNVIGLTRRKAEQEKALQSLKDSLYELGSAGVQVKDLEMGLLDFPCMVEDRMILLCWKLGEPRIAHWHGTDEGFAGRKSLSDIISNLQNPPRPQ